MNKITILGTAAAISDANHENTHWIAQAGQRTILVDCVGNPIVNLEKAGISPQSITDVILTHFHPDHVSGFALLLMDLWLLGRKHPLHVYGLEHTIDRAITMMDLYDWKEWPNFYSVIFHRLPGEELTPVLSDDAIEVLSSPLKHLIPSIGLRMKFMEPQKTVAYSSDTEPTEATVRLAQGADILIHEASGGSTGHSSAAQAGEIARQAGVKTLFLIHYPPNAAELDLLQPARESFGGAAYLTTDRLQIILD